MDTEKAKSVTKVQTGNYLVVSTSPLTDCSWVSWILCQTFRTLYHWRNGWNKHAANSELGMDKGIYIKLKNRWQTQTGSQTSSSASLSCSDHQGHHLCNLAVQQHVAWVYKAAHSIYVKQHSATKQTQAQAMLYASYISGSKKWHNHNSKCWFQFYAQETLLTRNLAALLCNSALPVNFRNWH